MFDTQEFFADAVRFKPVNLAVAQFYPSISFQLSPASSAEFLPQKRQNANLAADGDNFNIGNVSENFKIHLHQHQNRILQHLPERL